MSRVVLDIETTLKHDRIWIVVTRDIDTGEVACHTEVTTLSTTLEQCEQVIGHNLVAFDRFVLARLWNIQIPLAKCYDTLIASRLMRPDLEGGHSLAAWGTRLKCLKGEYTNFDNPDIEELTKYCIQDTVVTEKLYHHLVDQLKVCSFSEQSLRIEHEVAAIIREQEENGVAVDLPYLMSFSAEIDDELRSIEKDLVQRVPPTIKQLKTKEKVIPFNPASRQQIVVYLKTLGWKPDRFTEKDNAILDGDTLNGIEHPDAKLFSRFFELQKLAAFLHKYLELVKDDGRIHGRVNPIGAITHRMAHFEPNLGQVPAHSEFGPRVRRCFCVNHGRVLVGIDAKALELRMLAHYMNDAAYIDEVVNGDVHTRNQKAAGLPTRDNAKTFIYAFLYGAGAEKIGKIVGGSKNTGLTLIDNFMKGVPALKTLKDKLLRNYKKTNSLAGLDGRRLWIRQEHKLLNTLLQGGGAILMKCALVLFYHDIKRMGYDAKMVLNVHDEWQLEVDPNHAKDVAALGISAIRQAGVDLGLRCPMDGDVKIGTNWAETH